MRRMIDRLWVLLLVLLVIAPAASAAEGIQYTQETLDNGLRVIYAPLRQAPVVHLRVFYHVGSKDERPDRQGFAHMFEHMMFRGSAHVKPEEHMKLIGKVGGSSNAFTSFDQTVYVNTLPSNQLELAMYLEADRMASFKVNDEIYRTERNVVNEERRMRENQPYGTVFQDALKQAITRHPYRWTPIGEAEHLAAARVEELQDFFNTYYVPNNAVLVIAGDIDVENTRPLVRKYFGWIPRGADVVRDYPMEPEQAEPKRIELTVAAPLPVVGIGYRLPGYRSDDHYALSLLGTILGGGESSRLYRTLVSSANPLLMQAGAGNLQLEDMGIFGVGGAVLMGKSPEAVEKALNAAIADVVASGVTQEELDKAKTQARVGMIHARETADRVASLLSEEAVLGGDAGRVNTALAKLDAITIQDVQAVARKYLQPNQAMILHVKPNLLGMIAKPPAAKPADAPVAPSTRPVAARQVSFPAGWPAEPPLASAQIPATFAKGTERMVNGVKVIVMPDHRLPTVSWTLAIRGGSHVEPAGKEGLGNLTAQLMRRGAGDLSYAQLNEDLESRGIDIGVGDGGDNIGVSGNCTTGQLDHAMMRMRDVLLRPALPEDELARLKTQTLSALKIQQENPQAVGRWEVSSALFGTSPFGRHATPASIASITIDDVRAYYQRMYRPNDAILVISGDLTVEKGAELAARLLDGWQPAELPKADYTLPAATAQRRIILVDRPDGKQSSIQMGIRAYTIQSDEKFAGSLASQILTAGIDSRLGRYVRAEKGLAYGVHGAFSPSRQVGVFTGSTDTSLETTGAAIEAMFKVFNDMRSAEVTASELSEAKTRVAGSMVLGMQTIASQANRRVEQILNDYPIDYYDQYPARIAAVTARQIQDVMTKYVRDDQMVIVVVAPAEKVKAQLEKLGSVEVVPMPSKRQAPADAEIKKAA